ncbi:hypothetical protein EV646_101576 [Kribbella antiqua]|uniref:Uncharacterized protein n=1 Tax=Kribbella antiqua TaxID=2512217 RepID=A0A4R2J9R7_9ACTN|nr:hypothetical protein [Kribbella antiqua]TCO51585.1 hypothetical protein EV646_101576 [Kribbella antiqua]
MYRRIVGLLVAVLAVGCVGALPAGAGGPTSVLLSAPPKLVAVGYEDQRYADLQKLTGIESLDRLGSERHDVGRFVRATWLIHDMTPWRLDFIYPDAPGGPWIATSEITPGSPTPEPTWHRAADPVRLLKLLDSLGLLSGEVAPSGPTSQLPQTPAPETTQAASTEAESPFTGWRWTIPGFLFGVVVAVSAVRFLPKRRDWQLVDAE